MISFAEKSHVPQLKEIWKQCFGDSDQYIDLYFSNRFRAEETLVYLSEDKPVAMLTMIPCEIPQGETIYKGKYIYGVATLPAYQKQGISQQLLNYVHAYLKENGFAFSALVPAQSSLFSYYGTRGYETAFYLYTVAYAMPKETYGNTVLSYPASVYELQHLRNELYADGLVRWDREHLDYIIMETEFIGGKTLVLEVGKEKGYAVCVPQGDVLIIKEMAISHRNLQPALATLLKRFGKEKCVLRHRAGVGGDASGMIAWYGQQRPESVLHLSLVLD